MRKLNRRSIQRTKSCISADLLWRFIDHRKLIASRSAKFKKARFLRIFFRNIKFDHFSMFNVCQGIVIFGHAWMTPLVKTCLRMETRAASNIASFLSFTSFDFVVSNDGI